VSGKGWKSFHVKDLAKKVPNSLSTGPFGSAISSKFFKESGIPVIRGSNLSSDIGIRLIDKDLVYLTTEKASEFQRSVVRKGDLIFTCWGTINQVGLIDKRSKFSEYIISNKQMKFTPDNSQVDSLFLYYLFSSPLMSQKILDCGIGSSVPGFNLGQLKSMQLHIPLLPTQKAIDHILGTLDDKIELNLRMNETLESIARAIFKSWFIDFDPVRAKAEGRQPEGMDTTTAALFPSEFEIIEGQEIPKGWQVKPISEVIELAYGKALKEENRIQGNIPVYGSNGQIGWHNEKLASGPGIIIGRKGNPGVVTWSKTDFFAIDTTFFVKLMDKKLSLQFFRFLLEYEDLPSLGADSAVPGLNRNHVYMSKIILPNVEILNKFESSISSLDQYLLKNENQIKTLISIRDTLLPKLLSGELPITNPDQFIKGI